MSRCSRAAPRRTRPSNPDRGQPGRGLRPTRTARSLHLRDAAWRGCERHGRGAGRRRTGGPAGRIIYFDFDKSDIRPEFAGIVTANAQYLTAHPGAKLKLEGNTDERGTREYNIGLGERRAQAVRRALMLQGVAENQLTTVSFGAERPAVEGDDEAAWAKNRRVELVYGP